MAMATASAAPAPVMDLSRLGGRMHHMTRVADHDEDPSLLEGINYPGMHDVMLGRGGESTYHCGNIAFRQLVEDHKNQYYSAPRAHKSRVVAEVVRKWRQLTPPGRFLTRSNPVQGDKSPWHDVGDRRALKKASHSLRDAVRCFSIEKKQREKEQQQGRRSVTSSSGTSEEGGQEEDYDGRHHHRCEDNDEPTMSSMMEGRKRGRVVEEPEYMPSFTTTKAVTGSRHPTTMMPLCGRESSEFLATAASKPSIRIVRSDEEEGRERPNKMRRVACSDDREEQQDCRRGGDDDHDERGRGDNERCGSEERESGSRECRDGGRQQTVLSSFVAPIANISIPPPSSFKQQVAFPAPAFLFRTPAASEPLFKTPLFGNVVTIIKEQQRLENNPSPCGSAGWFTAGMGDLPVASAPAFSLPTAEVLVQEVSVHANHQGSAPGFLNDEDSLGWFSDDEEEEVNPAASHFTATPAFHVSLHRPVASREQCRPSSGRE